MCRMLIKGIEDLLCWYSTGVNAFELSFWQSETVKSVAGTLCIFWGHLSAENIQADPVLSQLGARKTENHCTASCSPI